MTKELKNITLDKDFKFIPSELSEELPMIYSTIENNVLKNAPKEDASYILTKYKDFDAMKEGFITLKIAKRLKINTITFKVFRDKNYSDIFILLKYYKDLQKIGSLESTNSFLKQELVYDKISDKEVFFRQLVFNFFIYNVNFDTHDLHYYTKTKKIGPLLDISIYDRQDKQRGYLFEPLIKSIIIPAKKYFSNDYIRDEISEISSRILKMLKNKRMLKFYEKKILDEVIAYVEIQSKMAKRYL